MTSSGAGELVVDEQRLAAIDVDHR